MFKKLDKDILRAIEWVAAEYKYILSLDNQLQAIENEKDLREKERSVRKAISILKYVNRAEFRAARFEDRTIKDLDEVYKELSEHLGDAFLINRDLIGGLRKTIEEISVERRTLMRYLSSYDNLLREGLTKAEAEMQLIENLKEKKLQGGEEIRSSINQMVGDMRAQLNNLEKWITAMQESLRKAKEISDISGVNRESKKQVLLKSPYLGKIDGYDKDNFGTTYRFKTKLGIVTFVFIPNRTNQDLSPKTLANLQEIFIKCTRKVYGGLFGVLRRPVRKEYGVSEPLFIDSKGFPCDTFSIGGIGYFTKLEDKSLDDCIGHAKRNIAYSWRVMQKKPKYFELIDPPYIFATARKDKSGIVVSENRGDSLNLEYFRKLMDEARPADGTPNEDIIIRRQYQTKSLHTGRIITTQVKVSRKLLKESEILPKVYARLANKNGLSYDQFIDLLVKVDLEIDDILSRQMREIERSYELKYRQYKNPDVPLTYLGVDLEFGMIFVRGYNSESGRMLLSFLDQTH